MVTGFEGAGLKALLDAIDALFGRWGRKRSVREAKEHLGEVTKELLTAPVRLDRIKLRLEFIAAIAKRVDDPELSYYLRQVRGWVRRHERATSGTRKRGTKRRATKKKATRKKAKKKPTLRRLGRKKAKKKAARKKAARK